MLHLNWQHWFRLEWGNSKEVQETLESQPILLKVSSLEGAGMLRGEAAPPAGLLKL